MQRIGGDSRVPAATLALGLALAGALAPAQAQFSALTGAQIARALTGHVAVGADNGRRTEQLFLAGGATFYSVEGAQSQGLWEVRGDQYCSRWPPGTTWVCYDVVRDGAGMAFVAPSGKIYPVQMQP